MYISVVCRAGLRVCKVLSCDKDEALINFKNIVERMIKNNKDVYLSNYMDRLFHDRK
jgi:hypothetical protein